LKRFSVIVPIYKVEAYIAETIKSLLNQTFKDFELIIVDDGTPDDSAKIAERILSGSDLQYQIIHTENRGVSSARNRGLEIARGEYVIMVDGDDSLAPDFLSQYENMVKLNPEADVYSTSFTIYIGEKVIEQPQLESDIILFTPDKALIAFYKRTPRFLLPTLLISNKLLQSNQIKFDEDVRYSEDVQFIWRVLAHNQKTVVHSSYSGYKYILHPGSTMTASGVQKILTWCSGFEKLSQEILPLLPIAIKEAFVPTGYFAMLHGAAKMLSYSSFKELYEKSGSAKYLCRSGDGIPQKVKFVSKITTLCPLLGYKIMNKF